MELFSHKCRDVELMYLGRLNLKKNFTKKVSGMDEISYAKKESGENFEPYFSIVLPTYNRKHVIGGAILSVLSQTYRKFELIIVDDGSQDGTSEYIKETFLKEISAGIIKLFIFSANKGMCKARNYAIHKAQNDWIAYIDSDNVLAENFLQIFSEHILQYPSKKTFYCKFVCTFSPDIIVGKIFNYEELKKTNYIDTGTFVHHKILFEQLGGFDARIVRQADWDLALRYTKNNLPVFIDKVLLNYCDDQSSLRSSTINNPHVSALYLHRKNNILPKITTIIISFNHERYIAQAIESALLQAGDFDHEIVISDDGSTDNTPQIIAYYQKKYPMFITNISTRENKGLSANYKYALAHCKGDFIAVLEGDDYWLDSKKIQSQVKFLLDNNDCAMVFSKIQILSMIDLSVRTLKRQENLLNKLAFKDFISHSDLNRMGTFSTCMFKTLLMSLLPDFLFRFTFSEIPLVLYMLNFGYIGYIGDVQTAYRQHDKGVWSGATKEQQTERKYNVALNTIEACAPEYKESLAKYIEEELSLFSNQTVTIDALRKKYFV